MANDKNDIVIRAQADTKQAEANIQQLDAKIKTMAANSPRVQALERNISGVGSKAASMSGGSNMAKMSGAGFSALSGSLTGVLTKLGMLGLAVASVKAIWDSYNKQTQITIDHLNKVAEASEKYYNTFKEQSQGILDNLQQLNDLANDGYLDNESLRQTNSLVSQLNSLWGDVGLTVDQTTGKISGLEQATKKINDSLRAMSLEAAKARQESARLALEQAKKNKAAETYTDSNGVGRMTLYGATKLALDFDKSVGLFTGARTGDDSVTARYDELDAAIKTAEADFLAATQAVKSLEAQTTNADIAKTVTAGKKLIGLQRGYVGLDLEELGLRQALATAQASGGDVAGAQSALDSYTSSKNQARYNLLTRQIEADKERQAYAQERYEVGLKHGDVTEITKRLEDLIAANKALEDHSAEAQRLAAGMYKPATPEKDVIKTLSRGTFDAFGLGSLSGGNIQQQQLDVQKKIERNTQQLAIPVVGE